MNDKKNQIQNEITKAAKKNLQALTKYYKNALPEVKEQEQKHKHQLIKQLKTLNKIAEREHLEKHGLVPITTVQIENFNAIIDSYINPVFIKLKENLLKNGYETEIIRKYDCLEINLLIPLENNKKIIYTVNVTPDGINTSTILYDYNQVNPFIEAYQNLFENAEPKELKLLFQDFMESFAKIIKFIGGENIINTPETGKYVDKTTAENNEEVQEELADINTQKVESYGSWDQELNGACGDIIDKIINNEVMPTVESFQEQLKENGFESQVQCESENENEITLYIPLGNNRSIDYRVLVTPTNLEITVLLYNNNYINDTRYYQIDLSDKEPDALLQNFSEAFREMTAEKEDVKE